MECLIACPNYPDCECGDEDKEFHEEFLDQDEFDDWFTEEE